MNLFFTTLITAVFMVSAVPQAVGDSDDLRAAVQNPVASMYSLPFKNIFDSGAQDGDAYILSIQPVIPITVGGWNLVNRVIAPIASVDGYIEGTPGIPEGDIGDGATGLGDINYSLFFSPTEVKTAIWGVGPSINLPTATSNHLGSGKWSGGPTGVVLAQPRWGTLGCLVRQLWSFAGDDDRSSVNQFLIEPWVNYNLPDGWYLITDIVATANWNRESSQRWTIPLGGGAGKLFKIGNQPMSCSLEAYTNIEKPDGAPDWQMSFTVQFLFPKR